MSSIARAQWSGRLAFVLAAAGSAVGLGNIWKFPYITGVNGGGAFVLVYLACIALVGIPIFIAELFIGQKAQKDVVQSFEVTHREGSPWRFAGWIGMISGFLILSFYSVVGGWVLDFVVHAATGAFSGDPDEVGGLMGELFSSGGTQVLWHTVFMALTIFIVAFGVSSGIERAAKILMPALFVLLGGLFVYSFSLEGFGPAMSFLFTPDASKLTAHGIMEAVGHSFFTLSLGMGAMITYGSYLSREESLVKTALLVGFMDTLIALVAGIVIFAIVFTNGVEPGAGPALMFKTLPVLFGQMDGGGLVGIAFFLLVAFAALTSAVSLLEVVVAYWVDKKGKSRAPTTILVGLSIYALGILSALSFNVLGEVKFLDMTWFDLLDALTSRIMLPLGGLIISAFFGWQLGARDVADAVDKPEDHVLTIVVLWLARVVAPVAIFLVLVNGLFPDLFKFGS